MARININVGAAANDGTGDKLRDAIVSVNTMFTENYASIASLSSNVTTLNTNYSIMNTAVTSLSATVSTLIAPNKPLANNVYPVVPYITVNAGVAPAVNMIYLIPWKVGYTATLTSLIAYVTTLAAGGFFSLALYANNPLTNKPTGVNLANTGFTSSTGAVGIVESPLTANYQVTPNQYWIGFQCSTASAIFQNGSAAQAISGYNLLVGDSNAAVVVAGAQSILQGFAIANTWGTWPDLTGVTFGNHQSARGAAVYVRFASVP